MNQERVGKFLASLREKQGLTQQMLADELFVSREAVSKWERGVNMPTISLLIPLSKILKVDVTEILMGKEKINKI